MYIWERERERTHRTATATEPTREARRTRAPPDGQEALRPQRWKSQTVTKKMYRKWDSEHSSTATGYMWEVSTEFAHRDLPHPPDRVRASGLSLPQLLSTEPLVLKSDTYRMTEYHTRASTPEAEARKSSCTPSSTTSP